MCPISPEWAVLKSRVKLKFSVEMLQRCSATVVHRISVALGSYPGVPGEQVGGAGERK